EIPRYYHIHDSEQMVWLLSGNVLVAAPSSNNIEPITLAIIACRDTKLFDEGKGNLVYLGIKDKNLSLFCTETEGKPTLQLKEINIMDLYRETISQQPFLFFHSVEGSISSFQPFSYPGWFIATSSVPSQPVFLTEGRGSTNTNFYLAPKI
ncbi:Interleukin-36 beta, partial [Fukomys damarensis]